MTLGDFEDLLRRLPRRYQALLLDRIVDCRPGESALAHKCVTVNEPFFQGHFPDYPVMPGVLIVESLIQLSMYLSMCSGHGAPAAVKTLDGVRFKRQVIPGDVLVLTSRMRGEGRFEVQASVDDELAAAAEMVLTWPAPRADDEEEEAEEE